MRGQGSTHKVASAAIAQAQWSMVGGGGKPMYIILYSSCTPTNVHCTCSQNVCACKKQAA